MESKCLNGIMMAAFHCAHPCAQPFGQASPVQIGSPADLSIDAGVLSQDWNREGDVHGCTP